MPFNKRARIEIENQTDEAYIKCFYIDYELYSQPLSEDTFFFNAHWRRENPTKGWAPQEIQTNSMETQVKNLDGKDNYVILDTEGAGQYIGCNHSVAHFQGTWWGEGDDMIFIDDDTWPPSYHGSGGGDYFSQGWGMQKNAYPFCGTVTHEEDVPNYQVSYPWHLLDPVRVSKKIKVTLEHGHAKYLRDDWSTTAYWYQTLPGPKLDILSAEHRVPRKPQFPPADNLPAPDLKALGPTRKAMVEQREDRMRTFVEDRNEWVERRAKGSRERAKNNIEFAKDVRKRFLESLRQ